MRLAGFFLAGGFLTAFNSSCCLGGWRNNAPMSALVDSSALDDFAMPVDPVGPFQGPVLKLERAKHHIDDFIAQAEAFYDKPGGQFTIEHNPQTRQRTLSVNIDPAVPDHFALIIGDAIHNLRSALDHLTWDIVSPFNPPRPKDVQFPFCQKAESFEAILAQRQVTLASVEVVEKFRELKPYLGGNDLLYALHQLDIADKHQLVLTINSLVGFDRLNIRDFDEGAQDSFIENTAFPNIGKDNRIAVWRYDPSVPWKTPKLEKNIQSTIQVLFREGQPLGGKSVAASLRSIAVMIAAAIDSFTP